MKADIGRDRDGWYYCTSDMQSEPLASYAEAIRRLKAAGHEYKLFGGWLHRLPQTIWTNHSIDGYPEWEIENPKADRYNKHPPFVELIHKRGCDDVESALLAIAWDDLAETDFYYRDKTEDGIPFVAEGVAYRSLWWFATHAERDRFVAWYAEHGKEVVSRPRKQPEPVATSKKKKKKPEWEIPPDPRYKKTISVVIASDHEQLDLWAKYHDTWGLPWEQDYRGGFCETIGEIDDRPVAVTVFWNIIAGQRVAFVDATSQLVDWAMIDDWIATVFPNKLGVHNAQNFHNAVDDVKRASGIDVYEQYMKAGMEREQQIRNAIRASKRN